MAALDPSYSSSKGCPRCKHPDLLLEMGADASLTCHTPLSNVKHEHRANTALVFLGSGDASWRPVSMHKCPGAALFNTLLLKKLHAVADCV